ncbi:Kazal type serine protease inhibitor, partial [Tyrophagus putrescentiae]
MLKANCSLTSVDWELCRGLHPLCPADCLDIQDPVCSDDGKIHPNKCVMHNRNCGVKISERPIIFCLGSHRSMFQIVEYNPVIKKSARNSAWNSISRYFCKDCAIIICTHVICLGVRLRWTDIPQRVLPSNGKLQARTENLHMH